MHLDESVARVQDGDTAAFRDVVDQLLEVVRGFVAARSVPGIDIDDVVQRSFVEAYQSIGDYKIGTNFKAWLVTIARYQLMMETTRLRRHADYHTRYAPVALAKEVERRLQQEDTTDEERLTHLQACLEKLSASGRAILQQRYRDGSPIQLIANELQRSEGAVRKQLCLLRQQLHECITRRLTQEQNHG